MILEVNFKDIFGDQFDAVCQWNGEGAFLGEKFCNIKYVKESDNYRHYLLSLIQICCVV